MSVRYTCASAREGIRALINELSKENREKASNVLLYVHSMKRIHLVVAGCEPPRAMLIRPVDEFTLGYTTRVPSDGPALDNHIGVVRTDEGQLYFRENGNVLTTAELARKLLSSVDPDRSRD